MYMMRFLWKPILKAPKEVCEIVFSQPAVAFVINLPKKKDNKKNMLKTA